MMSDKNLTLSFLAEFCRDHVLGEKVFVVPSYRIGHQIGESLAANGVQWVNLRLMTLASLAHEVAGTELSKRKLKQITGMASLFMVEKIFRRSKEEGGLRYFGELESTTGLIRAFRRSIAALRMAGLESKDLEETQFVTTEKGRDVILLLKRYEEELERRALVDLPGLFSLAMEVLDKGTPVKGRLFLCLQDVSLTEVEKRFLEKVAGDDLGLVPQEPVYGLVRPRQWLSEEIAAHSVSVRHGNGETKACHNGSNDLERMAWLFAPKEAPPPFKDGTVDMFQAIGPSNECREILRRITSEKIPLDEVEIIHPPGSTYPSIFFVLSAKAGLKVTYAEGVPLGFTAPGRVLSGLLDWVRGNYQVTDLCRMIEGNALRLSRKKEDTRPSSLKISRFLKSAMIGWGRERYIPRLKILVKSIESRSKLESEENEGKSHEWLESTVQGIKWVKNLVKQFLDFIPVEDAEGLLDIGLLCDGISKFLGKFSRVQNDLDREALLVLSGRLNEVSLVVSSKVLRDEAFEWLQSLGEGICVGASGPLPGHIHLSSYREGGYSGRGLTFVAGLDQGAFPGAGHQDPILLDEEREAISDALITTSDALRERLYAMACLLASLRGKAVFSFSAYGITEERQSFPSSLLLQVYRLAEGNPGLDYSALISALPEASGYLPESWERVFDEIDWWLARLGSDGRLLDGRESIRRNFPDLNRGIEAVEGRASEFLSSFDGVVEVDEREFNPLWNKDIVMSASRFELLATCPFGYFLQYILGVRKPDELEYDQSRWLDAMQRGTLLHNVFFKFMQELRKGEQAVHPKKHLPLIEKIAEELITETREEIPPPSEGIFNREKQELMEALQVFLKSEQTREIQVMPTLFEASFGMKMEGDDGIEEPAVIALDKEHSVQLRGKIDRVDRIREYVYRVIDYKTGGYSRYDDLEYFGRGRVLQHALYSLAAEQIIQKLGLGSGPHVIESGYYFPTRKGEGKEILVYSFDREKLKELLEELLGILGEGNFLVNPDVKCDYCDYKPLCPDEAPAKAKAKRDANPVEFGVFERLKDYD